MKTQIQKNPSELGQIVKNWRDGQKIENAQLLQFALKFHINPSQTFNKTEIQSLITKAAQAHLKLKQREEKDRKKKEKKQDKNDSQEIVQPPDEKKKEEKEENHGGEEDSHEEVEEPSDSSEIDTPENLSEPHPSQSSEESEQSQQSDSGNQKGSQNGNDKQITNNKESNQSSNEDSQQSSNQGNSQQSSKSESSDSESLSNLLHNNKIYNQQLSELDNLFDSTPTSEILEQNRDRHQGKYGGGGMKMDDAQNADMATFRAIREFLLVLANEKSPFGKQEGSHQWDPIKLMKARFNPQFFKTAKFDRPKERNIWFFLDDSGSVSPFAEFIMTMLQGAAGHVQTLMGSEGKPLRLINLPMVNRPKILPLYNLNRFVAWEQPFQHSFAACLETFIKECHPIPGDVFVFWGDLMDACESTRDTPAKLRKILAPFQPYWLLSHNGAENYRGNHSWIFERIKTLKMLYEINTAAALRKAIHQVH